MLHKNKFNSRPGPVFFLIVLVSCFLSNGCNFPGDQNIIETSGKFVSVNGHNLWIETMGKGKPLFLIAGGPGSSHGGMHSFDGLCDSSMLVFIDNFGRGRSDTALIPSEYSIENDVKDLDAIRLSLGFDKINILGHSYGSLVAQSYAVNHSQHVDHLIIVSGLYSGKMWQETNMDYNYIFSTQMPEVWDSICILRAKGFRSSDQQHFKLYEKFPLSLVHDYCPDHDFNYEDSCAVTFNHKVYYQIVGDDGDFTLSGDAAKYDITDQLKTLDMATLIIAGRYDRMCSPKFTLQYKKFCPQSLFLMFENSGHNPQIDEKQLFIDEVNAFLKN